MDLRLATKDKRSDGIFGELSDVNHQFLCVTLEHAYLLSDGTYGPKLGRGKTYKCVRGTHHIHHTDDKGVKTLVEIIAFEITGIPDFQGQPVTGVLFHPLNYNYQSEGCVGVGTRVGPMSNGGKMICDSKTAMQKLMTLQFGVDEFDLIVE